MSWSHLLLLCCHTAVSTHGSGLRGTACEHARAWARACVPAWQPAPGRIVLPRTVTSSPDPAPVSQQAQGPIGPSHLASVCIWGGRHRAACALQALPCSLALLPPLPPCPTCGLAPLRLRQALPPLQGPTAPPMPRHLSSQVPVAPASQALQHPRLARHGRTSTHLIPTIPSQHSRGYVPEPNEIGPNSQGIAAAKVSRHGLFLPSCLGYVAASRAASYQ